MTKYLIISLASLMTATASFAELPADDLFYIPPQYVCMATDLDKAVYTSQRDQTVDVKVFAKIGNYKMIVQIAESAMKNCVLNSSNPLSCDLVSCTENPQ